MPNLGLTVTRRQTAANDHHRGVAGTGGYLCQTKRIARARAIRLLVDQALRITLRAGASYKRRGRTGFHQAVDHRIKMAVMSVGQYAPSWHSRFGTRFLYQIERRPAFHRSRQENLTHRSFRGELLAMSTATLRFVDAMPAHIRNHFGNSWGTTIFGIMCLSFGRVPSRDQPLVRRPFHLAGIGDVNT
jgi:hypothetical protein